MGTRTSFPSPRRYELDWLRVLSILAVFFYHSGRFFNPEDWNVKNPTLYPGLQPVAAFFMTWGMPLVFVISGASTFYALGKRSTGAFLKDRALRLLVPVAFGIFTHVMWQVYLERVTHGQFTGSFFQFLPRYFDGWYHFGGNFAWSGLHLWYLELLFLFSAICAPLFIWLRRGSGRRVLDGLGDRLAIPGAVYLLAVPVILLSLLEPNGVLTAPVFANWSLVAYLAIFVNGFLVVSHERLYDSIRRLRWISLAAGLVLTIGLAIWLVGSGDPVFGTAFYAALISLRVLDAWCLVLAILGFGAQHLRFPKPYLAYANEAVLPFYIMHQTVLLTVGYFVVRWPIPDLLKWAVIGVTSLVICLGLYEFLIRRVNVLRFLFGMKLLHKKPAPLSAEPVPMA